MDERGASPTQAPVIAGFGVMILLLIGVAVIGVSHVRKLSNQLTAIVVERNLKAELASTMKGLHDARYQAILLAAEVNDPFERDEQSMRFSGMARDFIVARDRFLALPLDAEELQAWTEVRKLLPEVETIAQEVFELILNHRQDAAMQRLQAELKPRQQGMMQQWDALVAMQRGKNTHAVTEANEASEQARQLVMALSGAALLVAISVAVFVIRLSRRLEKELFEERERALITLRSIGDAVLRFDQDGRICFMNPVAELMLGMRVQESKPVAAQEALRLFDRDSRSGLTETMLGDVLKGGGYALPGNATLLSGHGIEYEVEGKCSPIHAPDGATCGGVLVMSDVSEAREMQRKLLWHSDHDALTGLANRHAFEDRLAQSLGSKRAAQLPMSMLLINLEELQKVSETAGHTGTDELLRQLAQLMNSRVRDTDLLARLSNEQFGVLLHSCPDEMAQRIARQISASVSHYRFIWNDLHYQVGIHIGVVHLSHQNQDEAMIAAHKALQKARELGPEGIFVFQQGALAGTANDAPAAA